MSDLNLRELVIRHGCKCGAWWVLPGDMKATDDRGGWHRPNEPGAPDCKPAAIRTPSSAVESPVVAPADEGPLAAEQREYREDGYPWWTVPACGLLIFLIAVVAFGWATWHNAGMGY